MATTLTKSLGALGGVLGASATGGGIYYLVTKDSPKETEVTESVPLVR